MFPFTPSSLARSLGCPGCKTPLEERGTVLACGSCGGHYPWGRVPGTPEAATFVDTRLDYPVGCVPPGRRRWSRAQRHFEAEQKDTLAADKPDAYRRGVEALREVYEDEFFVSGRVLDVGGHQGRLRHFLPPAVRKDYVNIEPFPEVFSRLDERANLLSVFPVLREPCPFVAGEAERLPFAPDSFDLVHMRAVLDHLADPFLALLEARRVLRPDGRLLIGLTVAGGDSIIASKDASVASRLRSLGLRARHKLHSEGARALLQSIAWRVRGADPHLIEWSYAGLCEALSQAGFRTEKEHWPQALRSVLYLEAAPADDALNGRGIESALQARA